MLQRFFKLFIVLFVIVFLTGCASWQLGAPDDPIELKQDKAYMVAVGELGKTVADYNRHYAMADDATKAKWKAKYPPLFHEAEDALKAWKKALDNNWDTATTEQIYLELKNKLLILLLDTQ